MKKGHIDKITTSSYVHSCENPSQQDSTYKAHLGTCMTHHSTFNY